MNEFFENNSERTNIEIAIQIFRDLLSADYDFSGLIDLSSNQFLENGRANFISEYALVMNKEIGDVFYAQMHPTDHDSGMFQSVASFIGFTRDAVVATLVNGTLGLMLKDLATSILNVLGYSTGLTVPVAFLKAFLAFLLGKFLGFIGSQVEKYQDQIASFKKWVAEVYADFVMPEDYSMDFEAILKKMEEKNQSLGLNFSEEKSAIATSEKLGHFRVLFENIGYLGLDSEDSD